MTKPSPRTPAPARGTVILTIRGPLERSDLPGLFQRTCLLLERAGPQQLCCEMTDVAADAVAVDALSRLALAARRAGCAVRLRGACGELRALVAFLGLAEILRSD